MSRREKCCRLETKAVSNTRRSADDRDDPRRMISWNRKIWIGHSIGDAIEKEAGMPVNILDVTFISVIRPHCAPGRRIVSAERGYE